MQPTWNERIEAGLRSLELQAAFGAKKYWESTDKRAAWTEKFLSYHGDEYFSPLRPVYLSQLKSADALSVFSPLLARDGALNLARFFYEHPTPLTAQDFLIVPAKLSAFVPAEWDDSIAYYITRSLHPLVQPARVLVLLNALDERVCPLEFLAEKLKEVRAHHPHARWEVATWVSEKFPFRESSAARARWLLGAGQIVQRELGDAVRVLDLPETFGGARRDTVFYDFNPGSFYWHDSFVTQKLLALGAVPGFAEPALFGPTHSVRLSFSHQMEIGRELSPGARAARDEVQTAYARYRASPMIQEEEAAFDKTGITRNLEMLPYSFTDLTNRMVRQCVL